MDSSTDASLPRIAEAIAPYFETTIGHNKVALLKDGEQAFPAMLAAIASAKSTVCLESYIIREDTTGLRFVSALQARAAAGVEVLLMYDPFGDDLSSGTRARLEVAGAKVLRYRPITLPAIWGRLRMRLLRRNHRKSLVVDGQIAFTGGLNISDVYAPIKEGGQGWRDTHVRVEGPAAVQLERLFLSTWNNNGGAPYDAARFERPAQSGISRIAFVSNEFNPGRRFIQRAYVEVLKRASFRVFLTFAYFVPPNRILLLLERAARRGVQVTIILAGSTDVAVLQLAARGLYPRLLEAGVELYEYVADAKHRRVLHAKTGVVDGLWSTVGSSNFDPISLRHNLEVNAVFVDKNLARGLEAMFYEDLKDCTRIRPEMAAQRGILQRVLSTLALRVRRWL